ncbi:platelet glycoprotein Ib alpha chain-like [Silurus asotus]|uniref:Platelet glycoprotein Ib alpha chain-like n=1 Tax=Silurus asotus TaxID=30991 RepID=A0AAD5A400_SILAS|nr:platelet glycoprotein Ib alpha chain-like [Silurus asotus]
MLLILFLLVFGHSMEITIGGCLRDRDKDHRPRVSCESQGLTTVPDGIDPETQTLVLSQNAFISLSWAAYSTFTHLYELDLSQNLISTINHSGYVLGNLSVLRLSNNKLTGLGRATFNSSPSLMEVYLDGNAISSLDNETFIDLPFLELINLSRNKLHILPSHLLQQISSSSLKNFDLEENHLQHLPDNFFASKPELPYVYLSRNNWVCTCQVSYLQGFLDNQGHNVYIHTGPSSFENVPENVTCSAPPKLQGRAILELKDEEFCTSDTESQPSTIQTPQITSTTGLTTIIQSKLITTVIPTTTSTSTPTTTQMVMPITTPISSPTTTPKTMPMSATTSMTTSTPTTATSTTATPTPTTATSTTATPTSTTTTSTTTPTTPSTTTTPTSTLTTPISTTMTRPTSTTRTPTSTPTAVSIPTTPTSTPTYKPTSTPKTAESSSTNIPTTIATIKSVTMVTGQAKGVVSEISSGQGSVPWCWWLFITVLLLCIFSAIFACMLFLWLILMYITLYRPIKRQCHCIQGVALKTYRVTAGESETMNRTKEEKVALLPTEMIQETQPVFRSVLFITKGEDDGEVDDKTEGTRNKEEENKRGSDAVSKIVLCPAVTLHRETETKDRKEVFRKTLYRAISREEELKGWREVEESCLEITERDKGRGEIAVEREKTRYSLILREERGSVMEDRRGETEWLVGEWEMR